jgi:hypothetical protein
MSGKEAYRSSENVTLGHQIAGRGGVATKAVAL